MMIEIDVDDQEVVVEKWNATKGELTVRLTGQTAERFSFALDIANKQKGE